MQKRGQDGAAEEDVGEAVGIGRAEALAVALGTLRVAGTVGGLVHGGVHVRGDEGDGVDAALHGELELQLGGEGHAAGVIDDVEVGDHAEHALLLFDVF